MPDFGTTVRCAFFPCHRDVVIENSILHDRNRELCIENVDLREHKAVLEAENARLRRTR